MRRIDYGIGGRTDSIGCRVSTILSGINQIGIVVRDVNKTVRRYWSLFGIGPWNIYDYVPPKLTETVVRGKSQPYSMRVALATFGGGVIELIEPVAGKSIYEEFLSTSCEGVHHLACYTSKDVAGEIERMKRVGIEVLQTGKYVVGDFSAWFTYMDTASELGTIIEFVRIEGKRPKPDEIFPSGQ